MNYPDNFTINIPPTDVMFDMVKLDPQFPGQIPQWGCSRHGQPYVEYRKTTYEAAEIAEKFTQGLWQEVSFKEPVERPLVFPFTYVGGYGTTDEYRVSKDEHEYMVWECLKDGWTSDIPDLFSDSEVRERIQSGEWRVTSVGPQVTTAPPEPSKEAAKGLDSITIKVSSEGVVEATERVKRLAQAVEDLNISLESLQSIFAETREIVFGVNRHCEAEDNQCQHFDFSSFIKCD